MLGRRVLLPVLAVLAASVAAACGDDTAGDDGAGGGATSGATTTASTGASSASTADVATASGSGSGAGGGASGSGGDDPSGAGGGGGGGAPVDCAGDFVGPPEVMLELDRDDTPGSIAVSRGERELHLVVYGGYAEEGVFMRTVRASIDDPFPPPVVADDLEELCGADEDRFLDVSEDGLRAYVTCAPFQPKSNDAVVCPDGGCEILLAERVGPVAPFELVGVVGRAGFHPSVRADELEVVTNGYTIGVGVAPQVARRRSVDEDFDAAEVVAVPLDGLQAVTGATISPDGLELYAFARPDDGEAGLSRFTRPTADDAFGDREPIDLWPLKLEIAVGAPDLTPDCRALYLVRVSKDENGIDRITRSPAPE
jgi:hypothetical protein